jgi:hypothetical protein
VRFDTDKVEPHRYLTTYLRLAAQIGTAGRVCEIGVLHGGSLEMWQALFPDGTIVGVDNDPGASWPVGTIPVVAEQADPELPDEIRAVAGFGLFDLIVDDASHDGELTRRTFELLWPLVKPGGRYVVEDWDVHFTYPERGMLGVAEAFLLELDSHESPVESVYYRCGLAVVTKRA